jgi:hypothetical protein
MDDAPQVNPLQVALDLANARLREQQAHVEALEALLTATAERADRTESLLLAITGVAAVPVSTDGVDIPAQLALGDGFRTSQG